MRAALKTIWERSRTTILNRVTTVEEASRALMKQELTDEARRTAEREAHKLAGAVGTFGFWDSSTIAREAEQILAGEEPIAPPAALRLVSIAAQLRRELEGDPPSQDDASELDIDESPTGARPTLLIVAQDLDFRDRMATEARTLGVDVISSQSAAEARSLVGSAMDAVVLDLSLDGAGIGLLEELHKARPKLPVVVISTGDEFQDRVDAARFGGRGFLQKPVRPAQILDLLRDSLAVSRDELPTIVAVDDDPDLLALIEALLMPIGARVVRCDDPFRALNYLVEHAPDLIMLDVDMPGLNGIELCRVLRNDPRWTAVPILFLTARTEPQNVMRIFEAGADDFVAKPLLGPELVARNRQ
jgi:DNA-binding response OmpR family regulator/HPt (histidine-containing phosphotransfer) domain-containing protein